MTEDGWPTVDGKWSVLEQERLQDRVAGVTGSTRGIARAIAEKLGFCGALGVLQGRDPERLERAIRKLRGQGVAVMGKVAEASNAADTAVQDSMDRSPEEFSRIVDINLKGAFYGSQVAARYLAWRHQGVILQMGSIFGAVGVRTRVAYVASKHALVGLTKELAGEWGFLGIRVLCLEPGYIKTAFAIPNNRTEEDYTVHDIEASTPLGRYGSPKEVAQVAAFLVSDDASYMTGITAQVGGGWAFRGGWYPTPGRS